MQLHGGATAKTSSQQLLAIMIFSGQEMQSVTNYKIDISA
jgi:hypothetical protein